MKFDPLTRKILKIITSADEPLGRSELMARTGASEMQSRLRLQELRAEDLIRGKKMDGGNGVWVYWKPGKI
jgi:chromosome segregation and condensation protein ScpB